MSYEPSGHLTTDERQVDDEETWDSDADWNAAQETDNVVVQDGSIQLDQVTNADFEVTIDTTNSPVEEGQTLTVDYTINNTGGEEGTQDIILEIDSTQEDIDQDVTIAASGDHSDALEWLTEEGDAGTVTATVLSDDDSDSTSVTVDPAPEIPDEADLHAHWDAADAASVTTDGSGNVTVWDDQTDAGRDLTGTASSHEQNLNGMNGILFDGIDDLLSVSSINLSQPFEIYCVVAYETVGSDPIYRGNDADDEAAASQIDENNGNFRMYAGSGVEDGAADTSPHVFAQVYDGSGSVFEVDSNQYTGDVGPRDTDENFGVGGDPNVSEIRAHCYAYEILMYETRNNDRRSQAKSYLADKWGL